MKSWKRMLYKNSLSIVLFSFFILSIIGQIITGYKEHNEFLIQNKSTPIGMLAYLHSGHFIQATFENWESEFFQMSLYVILTVFLRQQGSSESKKIDGDEECDREPKLRPGAPWPVRKGGVILLLYKHSLSIALVLLFLVSFLCHWYGSWKYNIIEQQLNGSKAESFTEYISSTKLWFESFQNWQSEFFSVFLLIVLSIYLRQKGSPQSKPVDAPNMETGD